MYAKAGRGSDQVMVRLPPGMRNRIKAAADVNGRSMNAEIVATLEEAYPQPELTEITRNFMKYLQTLPQEEQEKFFTAFAEGMGYSRGNTKDDLIPNPSVPKCSS